MTGKPFPNQTTPSHAMMEYKCSSRVRFALFVKILLKHLKALGENDLLAESKILIAECTYRWRLADVRFSPLVDAIATRLLELVGPDYWARAEGLLNFYIARKATDQEFPRLVQQRVSLLSQQRASLSQQTVYLSVNDRLF